MCTIAFIAFIRAFLMQEFIDSVAVNSSLLASSDQNRKLKNRYYCTFLQIDILIFNIDVSILNINIKTCVVCVHITLLFLL